MSYHSGSPNVQSSTVFVTSRSHFKPINDCGLTEHELLGNNEENEEVEILFRKEDELNKTKAVLNAIREERDVLRRKVKELNDEIKVLKMKNVDQKRRRSVDCITTNRTQGEIPFSRVAGKVKLKRSTPAKNESDVNEKVTEIHGKDFLGKNVSTSVAEQLISTLRESSNVQEILNGSESFPSKVQKQFEIELELAHSQRDHVKSENNLLQLTLQEVKERFENIQLMFEKCDANNTAYQMALDYSEIGFALCKILLGKLTVDNHNRHNISSKFVTDDQFYAQLLTCVPLLIHSHMSKNIDPRDTLKVVKELTYKLSWDKFSCQTKNERILYQSIQTILCKIDVMRKTCTPVKLSSTESLNSSPTSQVSKKSTQEADFENAILLNELTAAKKELAEVKWQNARFRDDTKKIKKYGYLSGNLTLSAKDKSSSDKRNGSPLSRSGDNSPESTKVMSLADLRIAQMTECEIGMELSQALQREKKLESQIESMADTLQRVQKNSENRHTESQKVLDHFKTSYSKLVNNMKQLREKQSAEAHQLKQNIVDMTTKHQQEVANLKDEILFFERERENKILPDNETAL